LVVFPLARRAPVVGGGLGVVVDALQGDYVQRPEKRPLA
jgi:hypothetical protein